MTATDRAYQSLLSTLGLLKQAMEPHFARFGISRPQWGVLAVLSRAEEKGQDGLYLHDLGDRLLIRPPSVTGVVDGLVTRSKTEGDRRVRRVRLTPGGRALRKRLLAVHAQQIRKVMGGLDAREQAQLAKLLDRLGAHLRSVTSPARSKSKES
jgi:DNA-binding MarR family transcriptional regulator